jgi:lipopolysaccharide export system permease protein
MLVVIWDLFDHFGEIIKAGPSFLSIAHYYLGVLCPAFEYLVPACLLLAAIYALWQLTRSNELIAMRVSGISMYRLMFPFLGVGLAFSIFNLVMGTMITPHYCISGHRQWMIGELDLNEPSRLLRVKVTQERKDGTRALDIVAKKADWLDGQWWFYGVQEQKYNELGDPAGLLVPAVPDPTAVQQIPFLSEKPSDFVNEPKEWEHYNYTEMVRYLKENKGSSGKDFTQKKVDLHRRLAMPWACLIVTLFGIPAGSRSARQNVLLGVFMAVGFFLAFYVLNQIGAFLGIRGIISAWLGAWLSNIVFMAVGIWLLVKIR